MKVKRTNPRRVRIHKKNNPKQQKTMKKITIEAFLTAALMLGAFAFFTSCQKEKLIAPVQPPSVQTYQPDTSKSGEYKMIFCTDTTQIDSGLHINVLYKNWNYLSSQDTTQKTIQYWMPNNYNTLAGKLRISRSVIFYNQNTNHTQPYIKTYQELIMDGFVGDPYVKVNNGNYFAGDTMVINFNVTPLVGSSYDMKCKYLKQL